MNIKNEKGLELLVQTVQIFSNEICMRFRVDKCVILVLKREKITKSEETTLTD